MAPRIRVSGLTGNRDWEELARVLLTGAVERSVTDTALERLPDAPARPVEEPDA
jgi:hypothetical protein